MRHELEVVATAHGRAFMSKLLPTIQPETILGVSTPILRNIAKKMRKDGRADAFLAELPHKTFDENLLHALLLNEEKEYDTALAKVEEFLPHVDNWAVCDQLTMHVLAEDIARTRKTALRWMASGKTYTMRYGIGLLLRFCLGEHFSASDLAAVASIDTTEYYVMMMAAWYFATALAKRFDATIPYLVFHKLPLAVHNKCIQKACESYRITTEQKAYLRTLRRKKSEERG